MTDYFFTNIEPTPIVVERPVAHQNKSTPQQPVNGDTVSQHKHTPNSQKKLESIHLCLLTGKYQF